MRAWLGLSLRSTLRSPGRSAQLLVVSAIAAFLVCSAAAVSHALGHGLGQAGDEKVALILSLSAEGSSERSLLDDEVAAVVASAEHLARSADGSPVLSPEIVHHGLVQIGDRPPRQGVLRGVGPHAWATHRRARLTAGTVPAEGEVLVGSHAASSLGVPAAALAPGAEIRISGETFRVSGQFHSPGTPVGSELWLPLPSLQRLARREQVSELRVLMDDPAALSALDYLGLIHSELEFTVIHEPQYYAAIAAVHRPLRLIAYGAALMALLAAAIGATSTLAASIAVRAPELACLRAIGFAPWRCAGLLSAEGLTLGIAGTIPGLILAFVLLQGVQLPLSGGALPLAVDGPALVYGAVVGIGLLPLATMIVGWPPLLRPLPLALRDGG